MFIPDPPHGFRSLAEAYESEDVQLNIIGVVVDFLEPAKTRGTDYAIKLTVHDPCFHHGKGLAVRIFQKNLDQLPKIQNQGDVIILRNFKPKEWSGVKTMLSNSTSTWVVLEHASVNDSSAPNCSDIVVHQSGPHSNRAPHPNVAELQYAKEILNLENPEHWPAPAKPTSLQIASIITQSGGTPPQAQMKFKRVEDCIIPDNRNHFFVDLLVENRKTWSSEFRVELSVTDYTENPFLFNYKHTDEEDAANPFDGDAYGYIDSNRKLWPGPWGKMTLSVVLWPPHREFAVSHVKEGDYLSLKNVKIKFDSNGGKIEGICHGDQNYPDKINVSVLKPSDAEHDENLKALLRRKRDYLDKCKENNWHFARDASAQKRKPEGLKDPEQQNETNPKTKKNRHRKGKHRNKDKAGSDEDKPPTKVALINKTNEHVRCNNYPIPLTTISHITSSAMLTRKTPAGNPIILPFQNAVYKSRVRVLDFFPSSILDFCAPVRSSEFVALSDAESESDVDPTQEDVTMTEADEEVDNGGVRWEWRFFLLVTDANTPHGTEPATMELLVADTDGDYLFRNITPCDLRNKRNKGVVEKIKEKLWVLWGDLEERKQEAEARKNEKDTDGQAEGDVQTAEPKGVQPSARPFECFIKEYGVQRQAEPGEWTRMWRLCHTSI